MAEREYAGFWVRTGAAIIDTVLLFVVIIPVIAVTYGSSYWGSGSSEVGFWGFMINYIFPAIVVIIFWSYKSATPGKMITKLKIVDAVTGEKPTTKQFLLRYIGYYISSIPLFLGILWVGIDKRKQGWHDKIAGTVVIKK